MITKEIVGAPSSAGEVFDPLYAAKYDRFSASDVSYIEVTKELLEILKETKEVPQIDTIVELGSGTGESTMAILEALGQDAQRIICIDGSRPLLAVGAEKLRARSEELKVQMVYLVCARAERLPVRDEIADLVSASQLVHWAALADDDDGGKNPGYIVNTFSEVSRILKPNGLFIFDTTGHHFDFQGEKYDGQDLNSMHFTTHTLRKKFCEKFNELILEAGFSDSLCLNAEKPNKYYRIFNIDRLREWLKGAGMELVRFGDGHYWRLPKPQPYAMGPSEGAFLDGAEMIYLAGTNLGRAVVDGKIKREEVRKMFSQAFRKTMQENENLSAVKSYETVPTFAARKNGPNVNLKLTKCVCLGDRRGAKLTLK